MLPQLMQTNLFLCSPIMVAERDLCCFHGHDHFFERVLGKTANMLHHIIFRCQNDRGNMKCLKVIIWHPETNDLYIRHQVIRHTGCFTAVPVPGYWEQSEGSKKEEDSVTSPVIVVMKDNFIFAALTMVIFHYQNPLALSSTKLYSISACENGAEMVTQLFQHRLLQKLWGNQESYIKGIYSFL